MPSNLERLAERVQSFVQANGNEDSPRLVIAIAGGGSHAISTLAATPGASSILLEGITAYDRESFNRFVGHKKWLHRVNNHGRVQNSNNGFQYASPQAAVYLGEAARKHALTLTTAVEGRPNYRGLDHMGRALAVASASTVGTVSSSQAHITASLPQGRMLQLSAFLKSGRSRWEEDVTVSEYVWKAVEYARLAWETEGAKKHQEEVEFWSDRLKDQTLSQLVECRPICRNDNSIFFNNDDESTDHVITWVETSYQGDDIHVQIPLPKEDQSNPVVQAADYIVSGRAETVLLLPKDDGGHFQLVPEPPVLPPDSVIFPGSFNPPHIGHVKLAQAALSQQQQQQQQQKQQEVDASNSDDEIKPSQTVLFELSLTNADKPPLESSVVADRLQQFAKLAGDMKSHQWGILLTNAPLFLQKVDLLKAPRSTGLLSFCIGTDTLVRLLNPKYYDNDEAKMIKSLCALPCQFFVGGRLDQSRDSGEFVTGEQQVERLAPGLRSKFTLLPEFRVDLSSTEIRKTLSKE